MECVCVSWCFILVKLSGVYLCIVIFERERGFQCNCVCLYVCMLNMFVCVIFERGECTYLNSLTAQPQIECTPLCTDPIM